MTNQLILKTKLNTPRCFQKYFKRAHLHQQLNKGAKLPLTLITAGAGYGKSTLVSQWLEECELKFVWLSCDDDMDQLETFIAYLIHGFSQQTNIDFSDTDSFLNSSNPIPAMTLKASFISELSKLKEEIILVLDDFHQLENTLVMQVLDLLIKHPINKLHLYLLTRKEPQLNIHQHLMKQNIQKLGARELLFSKQEIISFAKVCLHKTLSKNTADEIATQTDGWIMGLSHSIKHYEDQSGKEKNKAADASHLFNKFVFGDLLSNQSELLLSALLICSLFKRFCSSLLYHVLNECHTFKNMPMDLMGVFEKQNLFLIALDNHGCWYRFHHYFQQALSTYGKQNISDKLLYNYLVSGSKWLVENQQYEEAIQMAVKVNNPTFAIDLFEEFKYTLLNKDEYIRVKHILSAFPLSWMNEYPELLIARIIVLQFEGKVGAMQNIIEQCHYFESAKNIPNQTLAEYYTYKAFLLVYQGHHSKAIKAILLGEALTPARCESLSSYSAFFKAHALSAMGTSQDALHFLNTKIDSLQANQQHSKARLLLAKVMLCKNNCHLKEVEQYLEEIISIAENCKHYDVLGIAYGSRVEILYRQNRFEEFKDLFERSFTYRHQIRATWFIHIWLLKALWHLKTNNTELLNKARSEMNTYAAELDSEEISSLVFFFQLEIDIQKNETRAIEKSIGSKWYKQIPPLRNNRYYYPRVTYLKTLLHIESSDSKREYELMSHDLQSLASKSYNTELLIHLKALSVLAFLKKGEPEKARQALVELIKQTEITGDLLVFTEYGKDIQELIQSFSSEDASNKHVQSIVKLLQDLNRTTHHQPTLAYTPCLKDRDIKILNLVSDGLKNEEIAEIMCLSPDSIKKYLYNVYQELGVNNRIKAALKAKELGLLHSSN